MDATAVHRNYEPIDLSWRGLHDKAGHILWNGCWAGSWKFYQASGGLKIFQRACCPLPMHLVIPLSGPHQYMNTDILTGLHSLLYPNFTILPITYNNLQVTVSRGFKSQSYVLKGGKTRILIYFQEVKRTWINTSIFHKISSVCYFWNAEKSNLHLFWLFNVTSRLYRLKKFCKG